MGSVFVAEHVESQKPVALKMVRAELAHSRELLARFAREALAGTKIEHPSVVGVLDYGALEEGGAYLVMPLVAGESLSVVLARRGRMPWRDVAELGVQVADALAAAWDQGFVHRDLKPDNILLERGVDGGTLARIIDFGVAKLFDQLSGAAAAGPGGGQPLTKEGTIIGTPGYMAPEQALGKPASHVADLYSLGVVLWEALVGRPRWTGETVQAILRAQLREARDSARLASGDEGIPPELDRLIERLVAVRIEARPMDARAVRDELRSILRSAAPESLPGTGEERRAASRTSLWPVLCLVLAACAALGGWYALAGQ